MEKQIAEVKPVKLIEGAELAKLIKSIANRGKILDADLHRAAMSCLHQAEKHGNITPALDLLNALPKSGRRAALLVWFEAHGKFARNGGEGSKDKPLVFAKDGITLMEEANKKPFYVYTKEVDPAPYTMDSVRSDIARILAKAKKAHTAGKLATPEYEAICKLQSAVPGEISMAADAAKAAQ